MARNGLLCADVPLRNYLLTQFSLRICARGRANNGNGDV